MTSEARVDVLTFGCRLNAVESDAMKRHALAAGHRDLTVINTCAVTSEAARQARQAVRRARRTHPLGRLVVTGCASEIERDAFAALPEVDAVIPNAVKAEAATWFGDAPPNPADSLGVPDGRSRGFVEIQNGCDHRCTFCVIPFGRGPSRSISPDVIVERAHALIRQGAREIVLTGVDITSYDGGGNAPTLGSLVSQLLRECPDLPRLRLSSLDCVEADPLLLAVLASEPRLMPHLHLSLQSGSDLILKRMKRRHSGADVIALCAALRRARPEMVFGADFIAGFPTETESAFRETVELIDACALTYIHVFPYSARPDTPAARMPAVPGPIVKERAARLRAVADERLKAHLTGKVGERLTVLTERGGKGRTPDFTLVQVKEQPEPRLMLDVVATGHDGHAIEATLAA